MFTWVHLKICLSVCVTVITSPARLCVELESSLTCCRQPTPRLFFPPLFSSSFWLSSHLNFLVMSSVPPPFFFLTLIFCLLPPWQLSVQPPESTVSPSTQVHAPWGKLSSRLQQRRREERREVCCERDLFFLFISRKAEACQNISMDQAHNLLAWM